MRSSLVQRFVGLAAAMLIFVAAGYAERAFAAASPAEKATTDLSASQPSEPRPPETPVIADNTVTDFDVPYGSESLQKLDVYAPRGTREAPVVIFVHGGEWARHDKKQVSYKPKFLNENGVIFVSTNYRLSPPAIHPAHVNDVASAIAWVHKNIRKYGGSPNKIFLMGHSAGCHLVTLVSLDPRPLARVGLKPGDLLGVVAWSGGAYDLVEKVREGGMYASYIRKAFGDEESGWRDASPVSHSADTKPLPAFLFVSIEPNNSSHLASERLAALIRQAGGNAESKLISDRTHFTANHLLGSPGDKTGRILLDFISYTVERSVQTKR